MDKELIAVLREIVQELRLLRESVAAEPRTGSDSTFSRIWGTYQANELISRDREQKAKNSKNRRLVVRG